jgi:hypothetical protein
MSKEDLFMPPMIIAGHFTCGDHVPISIGRRNFSSQGEAANVTK